MSSRAYARWEVFVGVVGVLSALPVLLLLLIAQLPSRKLRGLLETLSEADAVFQDSIEEGLLQEHDVQEFRYRLSLLHSRTSEVRARVHAARDWFEDVTNWAKGLTSKINQLNRDAKTVRANISTTSTREREERERAEAARRMAAARCGAAHQGDGTSVQGNNAGLTELHVRAWRLIKSTLHRVVSCLSRASPRTPADGPSAHDNHHCLRSPPGQHSPPLRAPEPSCSPMAAPDGQSLPAHPPSSDISNRPSSRRRKSLGTMYTARARALLWSVRRSRRQRSTSSSRDGVALMSLTELTSIESIEGDDDEWEDLTTAQVLVVP
ncbi:hypothetical protein OH77DRAFT_1592422 [Trametes cingulata]|nr:hypothetical protein OH77DRAFT_1592422 [Trametes cingulata]